MKTDSSLLKTEKREDPGEPLLLPLAVVCLKFGLGHIDLNDEPEDNPKDVHEYLVEHSDEKRPPKSSEQREAVALAVYTAGSV